jgi:hypothetical protein
VRLRDFPRDRVAIGGGTRAAIEHQTTPRRSSGAVGPCSPGHRGHEDVSAQPQAACRCDPQAGARGGARACKPRCVRIFSITGCSRIAAMIFSSPPQFGQCSRSISKAKLQRRLTCTQVMPQPKPALAAWPSSAARGGDARRRPRIGPALKPAPMVQVAAAPPATAIWRWVPAHHGTE